MQEEMREEMQARWCRGCADDGVLCPAMLADAYRTHNPHCMSQGTERTSEGAKAAQCIGARLQHSELEKAEQTKKSYLKQKIQTLPTTVPLLACHLTSPRPDTSLDPSLDLENQQEMLLPQCDQYPPPCPCLACPRFARPSYPRSKLVPWHKVFVAAIQIDAPNR